MIKSYVVGLLFNGLITKIALAPFHNFNILSIEVVAHFNEKKFVRFKGSGGENSSNKTFSGVPETWRRVVAMRNSSKCFFIDCVSKAIYRNEIWLVKKHKLFITVLKTIRFVKPAWPAQPTILTWILLMITLPASCH